MVQGPVPVAQDAAVGIVSAIRGTIRACNARCIAAYSHSGAVPQELRRDAVLAAVELINTIERRCADLRKTGNDIVFAVGRLHTDAKADSLSKVPGLVSFIIDLRSQDPEVLTALDLFLDEYANKVGGHRNVAFEMSDRVVAAPAVMDTGFRAALKDMAERIGLRAPEAPCGAGHDAAEFVRAGIPSCMILVRNSGESHNPDESMRRNLLIGIKSLLSGEVQQSIAQQNLAARRAAPYAATRRVSHSRNARTCGSRDGRRCSR